MKPITPAMRRALFLDDGYGRLGLKPAMARALKARGLVDHYHHITDRGRRMRALAAIEMASEGLTHPHLKLYLRDTDWALGHIAAGLPAPDSDRLDEALGLLDFEAEGAGPALHWTRLAVALPWPTGELSFRWRSLTHGDALPMSPVLQRAIDDSETGTLTVAGMRRAQTMFHERMRVADARGLPADAWIEAFALAVACSMGLPGDRGGAWSSPLAASVAWCGHEPGLAPLLELAQAIEEYRAADVLAAIDAAERLPRAPKYMLRAVRQWAFDARAAAGGPMPVSLLGGALIGMPVDGRPSSDPPAGTREEVDRLAALVWCGEPLVEGGMWWFDGEVIRDVPLGKVSPRAGIEWVLDFGDFEDYPAHAVPDVPAFRGLGEVVRMLEAAGRVSAEHGLTPDTPQMEADGAIWWVSDGEVLHVPLLREGNADFANVTPVEPDFYPESHAFRAWLARNGAE